MLADCLSMLNLQIKLSRIEIGFLLCCHFSALLGLTVTELPSLLLISLAISILLSVMRLLLNNFGKNSRQLSHISIGQQSSVLRRGQDQAEEDGEEWGLPVLEFSSEFLIVLRFVDQSPQGRVGHETLRVLLLPDSLSEAEDRRLRRYIKFECAQL